LKIFN